MGPGRVDPWLERHLRIAERRGLYTGRHLSRVQQFGLELLILLDGWEERERDEAQARRDAEAFRDQLRFAMVAAGADAADLWSKDADEVPEDEDVDYDYSDVDWQQGSSDDWEQMQQALATSRVEVSGGPQEVSEEPAVPDMGDEFDREWQ